MTEEQKKRMHPGAYKSCLIPYAENHNGEWIIKPIFKQAGSFENGLAWVESDKFSGYISKTGRQIYYHE